MHLRNFTKLPVLLYTKRYVPKPTFSLQFVIYKLDGKVIFRLGFKAKIPAFDVDDLTSELLWKYIFQAA